MFVRIAYTQLLALVAAVALATAPALAQGKGQTNVMLSCPWNGVVYEVLPDNSKHPGAFRVEAAKCGSETAWHLPLPGGVTASFKTATDVTAYLKEAHRLHENALRASDFQITANKKEIAELKALLAKTNAGELQAMLAAAEADLIKIRESEIAAMKAHDAMAEKLETVEAELAAARAAASKPAGS